MIVQELNKKSDEYVSAAARFRSSIKVKREGARSPSLNKYFKMQSDNSYLYLENLHRLIRENPDASQRDVSKALQMSLGMTNSLLKRFAEKGWIYMQKINARNIRYILTPTGMNEIAERSYKYVKRTMKSVVRYRDIFVKAVADAKGLGCTSVVLVGESDMLFLLEHACEKNGLPLQHLKKGVQFADEQAIIFFADSADYDACMAKNRGKPVCVDIAALFL